MGEALQRYFPRRMAAPKVEADEFPPVPAQGGSPALASAASQCRLHWQQIDPAHYVAALFPWMAISVFHQENKGWRWAALHGIGGNYSPTPEEAQADCEAFLKVKLQEALNKL
jgi:hypothetical protein